MKNYYRVMLGPKSVYADECLRGGYIGANYDISIDLTNDLPDHWRDFNKKFIPVWLKNFPKKGKISAGLACGQLWTVVKGIQRGDTVLCPNGSGSYLIGEVVGDYTYHPSMMLPHQRKVRWLSQTIDRAQMPDELRKSAGSALTATSLTRFSSDIEKLISGTAPPTLFSTDASVEDPTVFALERHLEDFLVHNWSGTELGKNYEIYAEGGELLGQQYPTDTGPIDILAISKDKKELLIVELKKGRASDAVVGQVQRYMGFVQEELAEKDQKVKGVIIALEDDLRIRRALVVTQNIEFYRYQVSFKLFKN